MMQFNSKKKNQMNSEIVGMLFIDLVVAGVGDERITYAFARFSPANGSVNRAANPHATCKQWVESAKQETTLAPSLLMNNITPRIE